MDKYIGRLLDNRYEILEVIGTGGMAVVYKARCHRLNRLVAIKILKDDYLEDEEFHRRFRAESQAVAMLSHPNIVSVYDVSTAVSLEADYIVMELIDGITLKQYMEKKGVLNWKETLHFAMQIAKALEHAHSRGIVHRDIKPHNIMVLKNGSVKVADFGIARMMSKGNTLTKEALGSVHYISPEQAKGGRVDSRSDIYSLGVVMYEMMSGRPPYDGDSPVAVAIQHINGGAPMPSTLNPNIPGGLEQIIMKAMAHDIEDRYVSATRMLSDMDEFRKDPAILFDYNVPPLDAVTKITRPPLVLQPPTHTTAERVAGRVEGAQKHGAAGTVAKNTDAARREYSLEERRRRRQEIEEAKRSRVATIAIISCSVVALIAIVIFLIFLLNGGLFNNEKLIKVPNLIGEQYDQLQAYPGLDIKRDEVYDEDSEAGQIIGQEPAAGKEVVEGTMVVVTVSLGPTPEVITMEPLAGMTELQASNRLNSLGLNLLIERDEEYSETINKGNVTRTEPAEGVELTSGQTVKLWISLGPEIKTSSMPNVVNYEKDNAVQTLNNQDLDLDIHFEEIFDDKVPEGSVVRTDPVKGGELKTGQKVTLYISKGPKTAKMPNVEGMDVAKAVNLVMSAGFNMPTINRVESDEPKDTVISQSHKGNEMHPVSEEIILEISEGPAATEPDAGEVTMDVVINLRNSAAEYDCRISVSRDGVVVYTGTVNKGTESITIPNQTGSGPVVYTVVINDSDGWEELVDFSK